MAEDIDFGDGSWEDARGTVQHLLRDHHRVLKGNGQDGMEKTLTSLVATLNTRETERKEEDDKRHKSNTTRLNIIIALASVATIIVAFLGIAHRL